MDETLSPVMMPSSAPSSAPQSRADLGCLGAGSTYKLPECFTFSPSYKLKVLLPKGTAVRLVDIDALDGGERKSSPQLPQFWIIRNDDDLLVNRELVRSGYAFVRKGSAKKLDIANDLVELEMNAKQKGLGIYKTCDAGGSESGSGQSFVAEFEELERTTQIQYGDDGGKEVIVSREPTSSSPPRNPGDTKSCFDFDTFEDALQWYERYYPYYGDVAKMRNFQKEN